VSANRVWISASVTSGSSPTSVNSQSLCCSTAFDRRSPPLGSGAQLPVAVSRFVQRMAVLTLTLKTPAAPRREAPSPTVSTTRSRRSNEYAAGMGSSRGHLRGRLASCADSRKVFVGVESNRSEDALIAATGGCRVAGDGCHSFLFRFVSQANRHQGLNLRLTARLIIRNIPSPI
jgi:hypothetical protein